MKSGSLLYLFQLAVILCSPDMSWGQSRVKGMFFPSTLENQELDLFLGLTFQKEELAVLITDCRIC